MCLLWLARLRSVKALAWAELFRNWRGAAMRTRPRAGDVRPEPSSTFPPTQRPSPPRTCTAPWKTGRDSVAGRECPDCAGLAQPRAPLSRLGMVRRASGTGMGHVSAYGGGLRARILQPAAVGRTATPSQSIGLLIRLKRLGKHSFWPMDTPIAELLPESVVGRLQGYRQITDAVLLATAMRRNGQLVTLDGALPRLVPEDARRHVHVVQV